MSLCRIGFVTLLTWMLHSSAVSCGETAWLTWEELFSGMRVERGRLVSGVYSASGLEARARTPSPAVPFGLYSVFSFGEEKVRFEVRTEEQVGRDGQLLEQDVHRLVCFFPDRTYLYNSHGGAASQLMILGQGAEGLESHPGLRGYLDPRCLGLIRMYQMYIGIPFERAADEFYAGLSPSTVRVTQEGEGIYRAWSVSRGGRVSCWIDAKRGFTLNRFRIEIGKGLESTGEFVPFSRHVAEDQTLRTNLEEKNLRWDPVLDVPEEIELGWRRFDDVWVPESYRHVAYGQVENDSEVPGGPALKVVRQEMTLAFDWISVNSEPYDDLFDYQRFDLPAQTPVFDHRGIQPVLVDRIGTQPVLVSAEGHPIGVRGWIIFANVIVLGAMVIKCFLDRRRGRAESAN